MIEIEINKEIWNTEFRFRGPIGPLLKQDAFKGHWPTPGASWRPGVGRRRRSAAGLTARHGASSRTVTIPLNGSPRRRAEGKTAAQPSNESPTACIATSCDGCHETPICSSTYRSRVRVCPGRGRTNRRASCSASQQEPSAFRRFRGDSIPVAFISCEPGTFKVVSAVGSLAHPLGRAVVAASRTCWTRARVRSQKPPLSVL